MTVSTTCLAILYLRLGWREISLLSGWINQEICNYETERGPGGEPNTVGGRTGAYFASTRPVANVSWPRLLRLVVSMRHVQHCNKAASSAPSLESIRSSEQHDGHSAKRSE